MPDRKYLEDDRSVRRALREASATIRQELPQHLWNEPDVLIVMGVIWATWARRGDRMREVDPDCFSTKENPL